ncbi:MAG TPA: C40 family peptidase [Gemmatimonadaceae bacterium]|nr:C40 family peptidase [Gemmatimonadaceae bacterium]
MAPLSSNVGRIQAGRVTVRVPIAPLMSEPAVSSGQVTQLLRGHQADVLDADGNWLRLRGADDYAGWCHSGYVTREAGFEDGPLQAAWRAERRMSIGCVVRTAAATEIELPLGALLGPDEVVTRGIAMNHRARARYFAPDADLIVRRAAELFAGASYQWGGVTPWGADCSGFIQTMFALHGTQLPRDAWMQAERGREVTGDVIDLEPADLLFFSDRSDGRPTHVALSLGGADCAHCSLANGGFGINTLDADDGVALTLRETFRFARRVL